MFVCVCMYYYVFDLAGDFLFSLSLSTKDPSLQKDAHLQTQCPFRYLLIIRLLYSSTAEKRYFLFSKSTNSTAMQSSLLHSFAVLFTTPSWCVIYYYYRIKPYVFDDDTLQKCSHALSPSLSNVSVASFSLSHKSIGERSNLNDEKQKNLRRR